MSSHDKSNKSGAQQPRKPIAKPARKSPIGGFTFVDQSTDPRSLADRRIVSQNQRHVIRSHVMRSVRKAENEQGIRRSTGRDGSKRDAKSATRTDDISSRADHAATDSTALQSRGRPGHYTISTFRLPLEGTLNVPRSPSVTKWDPFCTFPHGKEPPHIIDGLMQYCLHTFMPMSFPAEKKTFHKGSSRINRIQMIRHYSPTAFYGVLTTIAAHRAIVLGRHLDLSPSSGKHERLLLDNELWIMKQHTLVNTRRAIESGQALSMDVVEAIFGLVSTASLLGNFNEARQHLRYVQTVIDTSGGMDPIANLIPLYDVTSAQGTLSAPLFRLTWRRFPLPEPTASRIAPPTASPISRLGSGFFQVSELSEKLLEIVQNARDLCLLGEFNETDREGLTSQEHDILRAKTIELQYDLLAYAHDKSAGKGSHDSQHYSVNPLEQVARLAVLGICGAALVKTIPSGGLGRAMTSHQKTAIQNWLQSAPTRLEPVTLKLVTWALFVYILGASGQPEADTFQLILAKFLDKLRIHTWEDAEDLIYDFLYIPSLQIGDIRGVWTRLQTHHSAKSPSEASSLGSVFGIP